MTYASRKETYATAEGSGHFGLCGTVCREAPCAPGQGENVRTRTVRTDRNSRQDAPELGMWDKFPADKCLPDSRQSLPNQGSDALSRSLKNNFLKNFQENAEIRRTPYCKLRISAYNRDITKNGIAKSGQLFTTPYNQPNITRLIASRNSTVIGILGKPSIASPAMGKERAV